MTPSANPEALGVLSKITVPRSTAPGDDRPRRRDHHQAPSADPTRPARIPYVRVLKVLLLSTGDLRKAGASYGLTSIPIICMSRSALREVARPGRRR
jgi:hypothetical protein